MLSPAMSPDRVRAELGRLGIQHPGTVYAQLAPALLLELALARGEGVLAANGAFVANTGKHTGRAPKDRYLVSEPSSQADLAWGPINRPMEQPTFERLLHRVGAYVQGRDLFVCDGVACADPEHALPVRVIADKAWHALFAQSLLRDSSPSPLVGEGERRISPTRREGEKW